MVSTVTFSNNNEIFLSFSLRKSDHCLLLGLHNMIAFFSIYVYWMEPLSCLLRISDPRWSEKLASLLRKCIPLLLRTFVCLSLRVLLYSPDSLTARCFLFYSLLFGAASQLPNRSHRDLLL